QGGAKGPKEIAAALPKISYTGPRGPLEIDPATNNVVQNFYIYDTVQGENGLTQKVIATIPAVRDPVNGCTLQGS
ncbi:MAG: ABC transporter, partial [Alphaproteobacteria bacterium HGW-Alphaproteobacteria-2]